MHYSIVGPEDVGGKRVLDEVLQWLDAQDEMRAERERYEQVCGSPEILVQIARTPITFAQRSVEAAPEPEYEYSHAAHNEIDEFLL